jgi:outer membrane protein
MVKPFKICLLAAAVSVMLLAGSIRVLAAPLQLSLADSITLALKNSPAVQIAETEKINSVWGVKEAKANFAPSVKFAHSATRSALPAYSLDSYGTYGIFDGITIGGAYTSFSNTLSVSMPLYTSGKLQEEVVQAKDNLAVADLEIRKVRQQIRLDTTTAYFDVLKAKEQIKVNQESLNNLAAHLVNVQAQYGEGVVNKGDLLRSEVEKINAMQDGTKAQNSYNLALSKFKHVLGLPLASGVEVQDELIYEKYGRSLEECVAYALHSRPDLLQSQTKYTIAESSVKVAKSDNLPQVSLKGSNSWSSHNYPGTNQEYWTLGITASINVFDGGVTKAKVKEAESAVSKAQEQIREVKENVELEVSQAYMNLEEAENRIATSKTAVAKAQEVFRINEIRYQEGVATNLDVIDAQLSLVQAKTNYNQALYEYNVSKAKLENAVGID